MARGPETKFAQDPVSLFARGWLKEQGYDPQNIDGARPDTLSGGGAFGVQGRCYVPGPKDGYVDLSETFAAVSNGYNFGKFVEYLKHARTNPFTKRDADYDLSWLKLNEPGKDSYQVDPKKAGEWKKLLLGDGKSDGLLMARWRMAPSTLISRDYDKVAKKPIWETTPAVAQFAEWALHSTEFGLLPVKDQLEIVDQFAAQVSFPTQTADQQTEMRELIRKDLRSAVVGANRSFTANQKISLYTLTRGRVLEAKGQLKDARELYELALGIDPQNQTAQKHLGILLARDPKTRLAGVKMLRNAYESGLKDPDLLAALAEGEASRGNYGEAVALAGEWATAGFATASEKAAFLPQVIDWAKKIDDPLAAEAIVQKGGEGLSEADQKIVSEALYGATPEGPRASWLIGVSGWWIEAAEGQIAKGNFVLARKILDREEVLDRQFKTKAIPDYAYRSFQIVDGRKVAQSEIEQERIKEAVVGRTQKVRERLEKWESHMEPLVRSQLEAAEAELVKADGAERDRIVEGIGKAERTVASIDELIALTSPRVDISQMLLNTRGSVEAGLLKADGVLTFLDGLEKDLIARPGAPKFRISQKIQGAREAIESGRPLDKVLMNLEKGLDSVMNGPKIRHTDASKLISEAKSKILGGYTRRNQALYEEGLRDLEALKRYARLEQEKERAFRSLLAQYPQNSRFIFRNPKDRTGMSKSDELMLMDWNSFAAKPEVDATLALNVWLEELRRTDPERAAKYDVILKDCWDTAVWSDGKGNRTTARQVPGKNQDGPGRIEVQHAHHADFSNFDPAHPETVTDFKDGPLDSIEDLNRRSDRFEALYQDPKASVTVLLGEVNQKRQAQSLAQTKKTETLTDDEAYQERIDLETSLQTLPEYVALLKTFVQYERKPEEAKTAVLAGSRDFMVKRAGVYKKFLKSEYDRLLNRYEFWDFNISREQQEATMDRHLLALSQLNFDDPQALASNLAVLEAAAKDFYFLEEAYAYSHLKKEEESVSQMYESESNPMSSMEPAREADLGNLSWSYGEPLDPSKLTIEDIQARTDGFRKFAKALEDVAFSRTVDAKIAMLPQMKKEYRKAENLKHLWTSDIKDEDFDKMLKAYNDVKALWASGDPEKQKQARLAFIALESSRVSEVLRDKYEDSATFNKYVTGVAIVIASAFTAGLAAELAAPFLVTWLGVEGAAAAGYFVNALVFTTSHRFFDSALSGDWTSFTNIWNKPLGYLEEVAFNFGMFAFLGKAMKTYEGLFAARLGEGMIAQGIGKLGGFVWEGGAFQLYGFFQQNVQMILHGKWEFSKMFDAFKPEAFLDGFLFLGALKVGGVLSMPLTRPATIAARGWVEKVAPSYAERAMEIEVEHNIQAIEDYVKKGKGNLEDILAQHEASLLKQQKFLEELPEGVRNEQTYALNQQALANVRQFREAYEKSVLKAVGAEGGKNPFGLKATGDDVLTYSSAQGVEMVKALMADPSVNSVKVHKNGLVVVRVLDPFGRETTIRLTADVRDSQIKKMQEAVKEPLPEETVDKPVVVPAVAANAG